ncbi:hypothetical protein GGI12_006382 [Dipsacomyces acuminosporus]|nr:hypothetical protein GGI12_006382 [Dipsacomyces acuminosporus]
MLVAPTEDSMIGGQDKAGEVEDVLDLGEDEDDPWGIEDVALEGNNAGQLTEDTHADTHAAESSSPTPEQLLLAKSMILENSLLHLAVMIRGFVSACLASPPLLDTLGRTLLRSQDKIESDECQELLNTQVANARVYGISPIHELFRHTVHTVAEIGMEDVAMRWTYEFLDMPRIYRYMTSKRTVEQWLGHLDKALLGDKAAELRAREIIAKPDLEPRDLDQQVPAEASRATDADADADAVEDDLDINVDDDAGGWGESDIDIDLDSDLNTQPVDKNPSPAADAPIDPDVSKEDNNDEAAGWGDDDDDIDLDADLENL